MSTPHGKGWTGLTPAPAPADQQIGGAAYGKGRAVPRRITDLEKELHQYQHNMGLLLIDKQEMAAKYDHFSQAYAQKEEILKREQAAHLNAISEYVKRDESIRKALSVERQRVADLRKALREMRSEIAEVKFVSQKKIGDVNSLQANIDKKSVLIKKKLNAADAKHAEAILAVSYADEKIKEIEARQCRYEKEKLCYETEWKAQENQLKEKEQSLHDWEKRLKENHNIQVNLQRALSVREEKLNAHDKTFKMKQEELQEAKQTVENTNVALKVEECDINNRIHKLHAYEMDIKSKHKTLEEKEQILDNLEDRISMKEKKLIQDRKAGLDFQGQDFDLHRQTMEMEMEQKHVNKEQELEFKQNEVNKKLDLTENKIRSMIESNESKIQQIIFEKDELKNKKNALVKDQQKLETDKADIKDDISSLNMLSKRLMERRESYQKEKNHLIGLIEKYKVCKTCRVPVFEEMDVPGIKDNTGYQYPNLGIEEADHPLNTGALPQGTGGHSSMDFDTHIALNDGNKNGSQGGLHPETFNQGERQHNREGRLRGFRRTRTMQAVIDEAKGLISQILEDRHNDQKDYATASAEHKHTFSFLSGGTASEQYVENTEISDGDASGGPHHKRHQLSGTTMQVPGENRYNLRHNRVVHAATSSKTRSGRTRGTKAGSKQEIEAPREMPAAVMSVELGEAKVHESSHMILPAEAEEARTPVGTSKNDGDTVSGKPEVPDCEPSTPSDSDLGSEDGDEDEEESPTGNISVGKKLWTFFTT